MRARPSESDGGFTLIELLVSVAILTIVLGAITSGFIVFLKNGAYTSERDDHSAGAIIGASYLERDAASASAVTTGGTTCSGTTNQLLLSWQDYTASTAAPSPAPDSGTYYAAYTLVAEGGGTYELERVYCPATGGTERSTLARDLPSTSAFAVTVGASGSCTNGQQLRAVLSAYGSDSTDPYTYSGCVKGRLS